MTAKEKDELLIRLDERTSTILAQTMKTNGRVNNLEGDVSNLKQWQSRINGGNRVWYIVFSAMGVILGVLATIATIT